MMITRKIKIINNKKFAKVILDKNIKAFVIYIPSFKQSCILIHSNYEV